MHKNETNSPPRSTLLLLGALLAAILLLRHPASLLHPQFWAEDGTRFFQEAFNHGFLSTILQPASGYLHTFPRLVAGLSLLFPLERAPLVFNLAAFAVQLAPALYLLSPRTARFLPTPSGRTVAALLYIALPASYETHVNLANSQWYLALTALCILVATPAADRRVRALETFAIVLFSLTGPFSILFLPLVAPRLLGLVKGALPEGRRIVPVLIAAGALVQLGCVLTSARVGGVAAHHGRLSFQELLTVVSMHTFFNTVFGINGFSRFYRALPPLAYGLGLAALGFLLFIAARDRVKPLLFLFSLALFSIVLSLLFPLNDPVLWLHPQAGPRYFLFAGLFILFASLHLAFSARSSRHVGRVLLGMTVFIGIPADFFHPGQPDLHWSDQAAVFQSLPTGSGFYVPVVPLYHEGMTLHKRSPRRGPSPLELLQPVPSPTPAEFSIGRPAKIGLAGENNVRLLSVTGWAIDGAARESAGGVFVIIDDKVFPAVSGLPADIDVDGRSHQDAGFSRLIPVDEIGPGQHEASIAVITRAGTGYYRSAPPLLFSTSQFFP